MKIGYPSLNRTLGCTPNATFRLRSYSAERFRETVLRNLACLKKTLAYNAANGLLFFRISSDLIPFASHPVNAVAWQSEFGPEFSAVGRYIRDHAFRISMHPDQFVLINSPRRDVVERSVRELAYHADVLDLLGLDATAKIQIHVGGAYGDKPAGMRRFAAAYRGLDEKIRRRLVIENDDRIYTVDDCRSVHGETGVPVLYDVFHDRLNGGAKTVRDAFIECRATWKDSDGIPMADYSSQEKGARTGNHAESIDPAAFAAFLEETRPYDLDIMLEIKDKEKSALTAARVAENDERFIAVKKVRKV